MSTISLLLLTAVPLATTALLLFLHLAVSRSPRGLAATRVVIEGLLPFFAVLGITAALGAGIAARGGRPVTLPLSLFAESLLFLLVLAQLRHRYLPSTSDGSS